MVLHMQDSLTSPAEPTLGSLISGVKSRIVQVCQAHVASEGLTAQQYWMLVVLHERGPSCLRALAERLWCDEPTASRLLKALMKGGWVTVGPDPSHGRRLHIQIAEGAAAKVATFHREALRFRAGLKAGLSPEEEAQLRGLLKRLLQNLDTLEAQKED